MGRFSRFGIGFGPVKDKSDGLLIWNMDTFECIKTKLDIGEFSEERVPERLIRDVLEAARLTGSGINRQHWRFVLVRDRARLKKLASDSTSGSWVAGADFAVIVITDPSLGFHKLDAGRVLQDMQLTAWNEGVVSRLFTGIRVTDLRRDFAIPDRLQPTVVLGFGYPTRRILGKKSRVPLSQIAFSESFGSQLKVESD